MKSKILRFGLVGCGAMGSVIAQHLLTHWKQRAKWTGFFDLREDRAKDLLQKLGIKIPVRKLTELVAQCDWIVEAASPAVVGDILRLCLLEKKNLLVMSTGGLLQNGSLLERAAKSGIRVIVPSGAIAGLDAIKAAKAGRIEEAVITTHKPPKTLEGAPYVEQHGLDMSAITTETVVFEGNAAQAMQGFPANINVAATLALACGLGPTRTRVRIIADPTTNRNVHHVFVRGSSGTISATVENVPSSKNPKTSELAVMAACAAIDDIFSSVRIGT